MANAPKIPFVQKLASFVVLTEKELAEIASLQKRKRKFVAGRDLVHQGQSDQAAFILIDGWVSSYKLLPGGARQIVDFQIPGDFLGLRSMLLHTSDHSIEPITDIEVYEVVIGDLLEIFGKTPRLALSILWAASRDEAMVVEHLACIGRRNAAERIAHFFLELAARLALVGMGNKSGYECPLTQYQMADALGLTAVHVNRVLQQLRDDGLVTFRERSVTIHDYKALAKLAEFDPAYLDHTGPLLK